MKIATRLNPGLQRALEEKFSVLDNLTFRLQHVASTHEELVRVARGKPFRVQGWAAWAQIVSLRDMVIIDACSWATGLSEKGGFFAQLRSHDPQALSQAWPDNAQPPDGGWRGNAFRRLFPDNRTGVPSRRDFTKLANQVRNDFKGLSDDRNQHRAHKHESRAKKLTARELAFTDTAAFLKRGASLMSDVYCLATNCSHSTLSFHPNWRDAEAQDSVDLILLNNMRWIIDGDPSKGHDPKLKYYGERRDAHYERLHKAYEAMGSPRKYAFNDPEVAGTLPSSHL